jgi:catechol 2,3-dioxygenase-like lactoylglutathione lyase family enzyme
LIGRLNAFVLDCPDPLALAGFYSAVLGVPIGYSDDDWVEVGDRGDPTRAHLAFQLAPDHVPPQWPDPSHPQQAHLDIHVEDVEDAEPRLLALGATRLPGEGGDFRVYADPAGHPFCLVWDA